MGAVYPLLSAVGVNRRFLNDFLSAPPPCFALGLVRERDGRRRGLLALRPNGVITPEVLAAGFLFGHGVHGNADFEVLRFWFHFDGDRTYHALVNPNNRLVRIVLTTMVEGGDPLFFAVDSMGGATAFRSECGRADMAGLRVHLGCLRGSTTTEAQYRDAVSYFASHREPGGVLLDWVCRDRLDDLDLTGDCLELGPGGGRDHSS